MGCKLVIGSFLYECLKQRFPDVEVTPGPMAMPQCYVVQHQWSALQQRWAIAETKFDVVTCAEKI